MKTVEIAGESWVKLGDKGDPSVHKIKLFDTKPRLQPEYDPDSMFDLAFPDDFYIDNSNHPELKAKPEYYH